MNAATQVTASAWRVLAETVREMSASRYRQQLIHETPAIAAFLDDSRAEKYIISAPKGFGKSLLLIAKSAQVQEAHGGLVAGSGGQIVDRPSGVFPNFTHERIHELKGDYQFWKNIWKIAIMSAAVKISHDRRRVPIEKGQIGCEELLDRALCDPNLYQSAAGFFTYLVELTADQQMRIVNRPGQLSAYFAVIKNQIAFAIDNVDEYFKPVLEDRGVSNEQVEGEYYQSRSNSIWTLAQLALVGAAYELTQSNSHVKVFCTIRREAFLCLDQHDDQFQQIIGSTLSIEYSKEDYRKIFTKNIDLMRAQDLVQPKAKSAMERFLGDGNAHLAHRIVPKEEEAFAYILRHTVFRPRDLMFIGGTLAALAPDQRCEENVLRNAISSSSIEIVKALITEMKPFFPIPDLDILLRLITRNVLSVADLTRIKAEYLLTHGVSPSDDLLEHHPFCVLYKIGLLGNLRRDLHNVAAQQTFLKPYRIMFDGNTGLPATEDFYLVHPALDQRIMDAAGPAYLTNFHSQNIIGDGLPWMEPLDSYFVLKADVCGFSEIMTTELYPALVTRLYSWARTACETLHYFDVFGGDSLLFIDRSPTKLLNAAHAFLRAAADYRDRPVQLRFGGSAGPVTFHRVASSYVGRVQEVDVPLGLALRQASRLEPFAPHGQVIVDDEFMSRAGKLMTMDFERLDADISLERDANGKYLIRKNNFDPPYPTNLWLVSRKRDQDETD